MILEFCIVFYCRVVSKYFLTIHFCLKHTAFDWEGEDFVNPYAFPGRYLSSLP